MAEAQFEPEVIPESPILLPDDLIPPRLSANGGLSANGDRQDFSALDLAPDIGERGCLAPRYMAELDKLFFQLKHTVDGKNAEILAQQIQSVWLRTDSDTIDLLMQWAEAAIEKEDYTQAIDFIDNIIALNPECPEGWMRRASIHIQRSDLAAALFDLHVVLQREPRHYHAIMQLGIVMEMLDKPHKAIKLYEKALEIYPQFSRLQRRLGRLLESIDDMPV